MSAATYRKKPVEIQAIQWTGSNENVAEVERFLGHPFRVTETGHSIPIETLEGTMLCLLDDFIIRGVQGEFYPCKPDIFEATYDPVVVR
jgi:hypothetical protein